MIIPTDWSDFSDLEAQTGAIVIADISDYKEAYVQKDDEFFHVNFFTKEIHAVSAQEIEQLLAECK